MVHEDQQPELATGEFGAEIFHYHVKTAQGGGTDEKVFWVTNQSYFGETGVLDSSAD